MLYANSYVKDATPAAFYVHTRKRGEAGHIVDQIANGVANWTDPGKIY